jgi:hypothetical protein
MFRVSSCCFECSGEGADVMLLAVAMAPDVSAESAARCEPDTADETSSEGAGLVASLLETRSPPTVGRRVIAISVDAIKAIAFAWVRLHVGLEVEEATRGAPPAADLDAAPAESLEGVVSRV